MASMAITVAFLLFLTFSPLLATLDTESFLSCLYHNSSTPTPPTGSDAIIFHRSNTSSYSSLLSFSMQNLRFSSSADSLKPLFIITPQTEAQIQDSVVCCRQKNIQLRVRCGGHDYEGLSYASKTPFVIMDLINFRKISIDTEDFTAWVEAGATLGELYYRIAQKSNLRGFPAGVCSTVGVSGHLSGGGIGMMSRKHGIAADHVVDARIVDTYGRTLDRESMGEDLFWAIRGGGGMSFGVIVAWKLKLVPVPPLVTVFTAHRTVKREAIHLVHRWQHVAHQLHEGLFIRAMFQVKEGSRGEKFVVVGFNSLFLGSARELIPLMNEKFPELGLRFEDCREMKWIESVLYFNWFPANSSTGVLLNRKNREKVYFKGKSDFVTRPIPKRVLAGLWDRVQQEDTVFVILDPHGGKMSGQLETELPFPHRYNNLYNIQYLLKWENREQENCKMDWMRELYQFMGPYVSKKPRGAYINYRDLDLGMNVNGNSSYWDSKGWGHKYFKGNFKKLAMVKGRIDPENFFRNEQSIPPLVHES